MEQGHWNSRDSGIVEAILMVGFETVFDLPSAA